MLQQIGFVLITLVVIRIAFKLYGRIWRNIHLGKPEDISGREAQRWRNVALVAFGQKKMFKNLLPAVMHLFIYVAFVITQVELIEIILDGFTGKHRLFAGIGSLYTFIISFVEVLSLLAFIGTVVFLARRNLLKVPRFWQPEMTTWPRLDANLILFGEIALIVAIFCMNGADTVLQTIAPEEYHQTGRFAISGWLGPMLFGGLSKDLLVFIERSGWWLHLLTVYAFLLYLPVSKHLHILLAFPNVYFARLNPRGEMANMPAVSQEVRSMLGLIPEIEMPEMSDEIPEFGARDVFDLSWKTILDAYTCTECGRCTSVCPANVTGKKLSPRKILMDVRDRAEEVSGRLESGAMKYIAEDKRGPNVMLSQDNFDDGKSLFDYVSREELHACTTCNACVEECPVMIDPLRPILDMRRYEILTLSEGPQDWLPMFNSLESSGAVWQVTEDREHWTKQISDVG